LSDSLWEEDILGGEEEGSGLPLDDSITCMNHETYEITIQRISMLLEGLPAFVRVFHIMKYIMLKLIVITFSQQPNALRFSLLQVPLNYSML
jgi:hypothetical protein